MSEKQKKSKYGNKRNFYINIHSRARLDIKFTACKNELMPEESMTSFTVYDAYRYICASGIVIEVRK